MLWLKQISPECRDISQSPAWDKRKVHIKQLLSRTEKGQFSFKQVLFILFFSTTGTNKHAASTSDLCMIPGLFSNLQVTNLSRLLSILFDC